MCQTVASTAIRSRGHVPLEVGYGMGHPSGGLFRIRHLSGVSPTVPSSYQHYNETAAGEILSEFKETASYAGLYEPQKEVDKPALEEESERTPPKVNVGDLIQATVNGEHVFPKGARVLGFSGDGEWVFTDQTNGGLKLKEITVLEPATPAANERPTIPPSLLATHQREEESLEGDCGESIFIRYRGKATPDRYRYIRDYLDFKLGRMGGA
jgi:hypothetical protein